MLRLHNISGVVHCTVRVMCGRYKVPLARLSSHRNHPVVSSGPTMLELELNTNINNYVEDVPTLASVPSVPSVPSTQVQTPTQNDQTPVRRGRRSRSEGRMMRVMYFCHNDVLL